MRIQQGRLTDARAWADKHGLSADDELTYLSEFGHITLAKLLLAQHRADPSEGSIGSAIRLLDRLLAAAGVGRRGGNQLRLRATDRPGPANIRR
ncbi:hypothetical protein E3O53_01460 [Cryobacterium sp. TMT2-18-3]|uniref:hypothetical protein n=1 Tax=unclassified Cryobacterium TaxID=2649013 RepID=UPI00106BCD3D|nr:MULTISPECIES: hypothetical protein [unclassified Cryobacterium]TFC31690.1 hypothetical protein E3O22_02260 [Cryobacterium sp. TMT2-18-2]TFC33565.1 hypothetical protein E3O18_13810 [Cryobacterium sp. TMT2-42-4]TFC67647.1 hypothetical protein E3O53_01460 [Cryobacterium sp. TMT2-18-3]